ncbi:MAG: hypothetical protein A3F84_08060 [Candidatus Handelsmanbacteria bacterium RIFCSPLOWO2_12_FULL_64_10]|uniref:Calcineurin-like phosphoesterase domain-containing protein n=1 Tax=Handelsmanbacteria sp. (strain RIFCSPLOWO2_12_FULL_64_10) TaxID=1817868 RepID=A0A1F6CBE3_HANXR|nr:MAG: hypothetical protein A3F84_08060 [Candidatus Handelsmanbacteria bacterium RIFCSPLOWO2_12_FULL_64_10]
MRSVFLIVLTTSLICASAGAGAILKGPYLQNVTQDAVTVMWETDAPGGGEVEYGHTPSFGKAAADTARRTVHEVRLTGLEAETVYHYRARSGGDVSAGFTFRTAPRRETPFTFAVYGDDRTNPFIHAAVADGIKKFRPDLVLHTGDLVVRGREYDLWEREFFGPAGDLYARIPFFPCLGNHEGNADHYYRFFSLPSNGSARHAEAWYSFDYGNAHFIFLDSTPSTGGFGPGSEQRAWLEKDLQSEAARGATWRFVIFHHPVYSSGNHESALPQRKAFVPLFERYGVDVAFSGHDHTYERSWPWRGDRRDDRNGVVYVVTGGGGAPLYDVKWSPWTAFARRVNHFTLVSVEGERLTIEAVDVDGGRFDGTAIDREGARAVALIDTARAATGLKRLFALKGLEPYGRPEALGLSALAESGDVETRRAFARVVSRVQSADAVPLLRRLAEDRDAEVRRAAAYGLAALGAPAGDLYVRLLKDSDVEARRSAAVGLRVSPDSAAVLALVEALSRPDSLVRYQAALALGALDGRGPADPLVAALKDGTAFVRRAALSALIDAGQGEAALPKFLEDLKSQDAGIRRAAADALGRIASPAAAGPLLGVARSDPDSRARESATAALGATRARESVPNLLKLLRDRDTRVRGAAARGLGVAGDERVIPRLVAALDDTAASVREGAVSALGRLTDQPDLVDPAAWKAWWKKEGRRQ